MVTAQSLTSACDGILLQRYLISDDHRSFEEIVRRHASKVFGVCLRVLGDRQLAEDATQDVFVTLASRAKSIVKPDALASWLHGVAFRKSVELRRRRFRTISSVPDFPEEVETVDLNEMCEIVQEELSSLPEKYRVPLELHYYDGKTLVQISQQTSVPVGTLSTRLQTGREHLRKRLNRRGVKVGALMMLLLFLRSTPAAASEFFVDTIVARVKKLAPPNVTPPTSLISNLWHRPVVVLSSLTLTLVYLVAMTVYNGVANGSYSLFVQPSCW